MSVEEGRTPADGATPSPAAMPLEETSKARKHIVAAAGSQRGARGTIESVSAPRTRRRSRRLHLVWLWIAVVVGGFWRRIGDSHRWPGRWVSRARLYQPLETLTVWVVAWGILVVVCGVAAFDESTGNPWKWAAQWGLGISLAAFVTVIWHDVVKSPHTARRVRHRIVADPAALLRTTLAAQTTKIVELDPPVNTVPRGELYDELLPGALARKRDVQIIVGDPGAGKTTALIDLASVLAKIGLVPVLLELRGERTGDDLIRLARERFEQQVRPFVRTNADADIVWRWLCRRQRVAILVDDIDQIGFEGEPGFMMRRLLENVATEGQAVIVTARPAGVPVGIAASAITIDPLDFETAVGLVAQPAAREPGSTTSSPPPRGRIERWVHEGDLTEAPLYLEALAELTSVGACPDLPDNPERWCHTARPGRWRKISESKHEWNSLWVRYMLLERFREGIVRGQVRRSLAIDRSDRQRSLTALEQAALGTLGATGLEATAAAVHPDQPEETRTGRPKRRTLVEFISTDDRRGLGEVAGKPLVRRTELSQHEAIDTGERMRILERDWRGDPQFRHRIMQAFLAGRCLAKLGLLGGRNGDRSSFGIWVERLMNNHHPEKLTAHLALTFAAIHADALSLGEEPIERGADLAQQIVVQLVEAVQNGDGETATIGNGADGGRLADLLDPMEALDPHKRSDPDDELIKLTTAANLAALFRESAEEPPEHAKEITEQARLTGSAMRWTKLQAVPAIAELACEDAWCTIWEHFTRDPDYDVRRAASKQLERNAWCAYPKLWRRIEVQILQAGHLAARGRALQPSASPGESSNWSRDSFVALGWVLPAIVSGLSEELRTGSGAEEHPGRAEADAHEAEGDTHEAEADASESEQAGGDGDELPHEIYLTHARAQLAEFATLAYEGSRPELEESLAQGFKADAMRHASDPAKTFTGPGWVASNRRLVADVALPHAESWYARMLLYQALALYAISGTNREDTLDVLSYRLHATRERHPLARQAAKLARSALRHAELGGPHWKAFVWSDDVEDAGRLPTVLSRDAAQLVGDVAVLVDLKEGSPPDRHDSFGYMEELPHCLSSSRDRHEILGSGCPPHCGWGFCPYRAASPDEPNEHRGLSRGFCRGERRIVVGAKRTPSWQRKISRRRMREFWEQMEFKARR